MMDHAALIFEILALAATVASLVYYVLCLWSAAKYVRAGKQADQSVRPTPPVSILKPLKGTDPEMYASFRSHCLQDYPEYEAIFGISDPHDPAIELVERLKAEFPNRSIRLILCDKNLGANTKVSNLAQMLAAARHEYLVVNDSDIRVEPDYLRRVLAPLADSGVGMVTCLYRGIANPTLGSRLESLGISSDFCPGVLVARQLEGIRFGLGSTMAFRRSDLEAIGGFEVFVDYLADDYQLGNRIAALGRRIELSDVVVETFLPRYTLREFLAHQLRWARTIRDSRFWGYVGLGVTFGLPWAILMLLLSRGAVWSWELLGVTAGLRVAVAAYTGESVLLDRQTPGLFPFLPLRDFLALAIWLTSFFGHSISWRGETFRLEKGKLVRE